MATAKAKPAAKAKAAKAKASVYKCPACGETYDSAVMCIGRDESGHAMEPVKAKAYNGAADEQDDAEPAE